MIAVSITKDLTNTNLYSYAARFCTGPENTLCRLKGTDREELIDMLDALFGDDWYDQTVQQSFETAMAKVSHPALVEIAELADPHNELGAY